jgi:hypothetical protein
MPEEDYSSKTVAQLKVILQEKGLPVSGKKADLIARLVESESSSNPKSIVIGDLVQEDENSSTEDLPFLSDIIKNGIGSVEIDKSLTIRYGSSLFMLIFIIIGLNSTSWYGLEYADTNTAITPFGEFEYSYEQEIDFGLFDYEKTRSNSDSSDDVQIETSTSSHAYDGMACETSFEAFDCEAFSTAGTINSLMLWLSLLSIMVILGIGIAEGFGKIESGFIVEKREIIDKIIWGLATVPIFIGTLIYGLMASSAQTVASLDKDATSGLGMMWWTMFLLSTAYVCYIYRDKIQNLKEKFMSDKPEASND